ncbi:decaprenyl-phosphate phosphoribosyltransferase [Sphingobacterium humi]|uniref:Decaprenyl-phosphate phosphoribosyltransferase n=1 Tax=Sphingobacterium humi TaxID=1796905 RepID=A0A6N8KU88_9SPHI|nr:decaprenyl-phosphate phosphoribosyltransferase [Sphingobacterium humi]MVZ60995.1 decaprenyl-phosphate phosphoribosyltransferase [Sphingobacterium humi]
MGEILKLLRPKQWSKNLFIFLPLFFAGQIQDPNLILNCLVTFAAFSFMASAIYGINDVVDVKEDRLHPKKSKRPIASGRISIPVAILISMLLILISFSLIWFYPSTNKVQQLLILGIYLIMNILYCFWLKRVAIIDVMFIAIGFVLRLIIGGMTADIPLTHWIVIMTFLLTLFIGFAKRRDDLILKNNHGITLRKNTNRYNLDFINQVLCLLGGITIVCYIMYTVSPEVIVRFKSPYMYITTVFVLGGIVRYLQLAIVDQNTGSPTEILLKDRFIQGCLALWIASFYLIIYLNG